jgi:V8-like Glu-specific endopeptidase
VRSKVVEFEKIKDLTAIEDYKKYGGFSDTDFRENMGYCTGFLVAPNVVLTASHCLWGSDFLDLQTAFEIRTADGKKFQPQQILGFDPVRDFLFLKIEGAESYGHLEFADDFKIGQTVYTLGNAHGQGIAIREGIMANETQDLNDPTIKYIRYSAGASPGNSGGPLLDSQGRIVALVFAATGAENYNLGTSCHDLKLGFKKFVENTEPKEIKIKVKKLFNFNLNTFLQKQILPFLAEYSEYPEVNELIDQIELTFEAPIPFELIGEKILTEVQQKSSLALKSVEEALLAKKQVVLDWRSFLSEKTPVIFPSQFDSSQNSFYKHNGRLYMKVAGFLDSPNRKDFRAYVEQLEKEKEI